MTDQHGVLSDAPWPVAREYAFELGVATPVTSQPLGQALGTVLAQPLVTLTDLPAFDTVAMDGWAVAGPGPWRVTGRLLAGQVPSRLPTGAAVETATGAQFPAGADAVLRREHGMVAGDQLTQRAGTTLTVGADVRNHGEEARAGETVLVAGSVVTPPVLGLAAAAGHDVLTVHPVPTVDVLVMGDELAHIGRSGVGRTRDAIGPQASGWLASVGALAATIRLVPDRADEVVHALGESRADIVVTTGGTAHGPVDQLHPALDESGADLLIDQVAVRPGHPMVLARLADGRHLLGLPGNPLAAAVGFVGLGWPLIAATRGLSLAQPDTATLHGTISAPEDAHRLMPVRTSGDVVTPLPHHGPAMLSGLAAADSLAVAPPGGVGSGQLVEVLRLPWVR